MKPKTYAFGARQLSAMLVMAFSAVCSAASFSVDYTKPTTLRYKAAAGGAAQQTLDAGVLRRVELSASTAPVIPGELAIGDEIDVRLFDDCAVTLLLAEQAPTRDGRTAFLATANGYDGQMVAVVVLKDGNLQIDIQDYFNGRVYSVFSSAERTVVKEMDPNSLPSKCDGPEIPTLQNGAAGSKAKCSSAASAKAADRSVSFAIVDILVAYDTMAADWVRSEAGGVDAFAEVQVQKMNAVLANTGLDQRFRFRLVGVYEIGGSAGGSLSYALHAAAQDGISVLNGVSWKGVSDKRDEVGADLVCVLIDNGSAYGTTGKGYSLMPEYGDFSERGYNVCLVRSVSISQTMTHEVGHNMGAGHATAVADEDNRGPQYHSYSAGYYFTGSDGNSYHTIMAYDSDGYGNYYDSAPFFSSPDYRYKSVPVGDATHNNSLTLQQTFAIVSQYRGGGNLYLDELGTGTESEAYAWETSPAYPWYRTTDDSVDGVDSVRSCEMDGGSTSWMQTGVKGPATLTFSYQMRTYTGSFVVTCDGATLFERADEDIWSMDWTRLTLSIPSGTHVVRFAYTHPWMGYTDGWGNGVRIDRIAFTGGSPAEPEFTVSAAGVLTKANLYGATTVEIPNGVKTIDPYVFACNPSITTVIVPDSVTSIGEYAFAGCENLTSVRVPNTLRGKLDSSVFHACASGISIVYYAPAYTIVFHRNDASNGSEAAYEFTYGVNTRLPTLNSLGWARRGFEFKGWATSVADAAKGVVWKGDWGIVSTAAKGGETLDVYAVWALKSGYYAVYFVRNDGAGTWRTVGFPYGEKTRMPTLAKGLGWARRGYQFNGWALKTADANNGVIWKGDWAYLATPVAAGSTLTVYASWTLKPGFYQVRFNKNDGTGKWRTLGFECGASAKLNTIAGLGWERAGHPFRGWASNKANADAGKVWKTDGAWIKDVTSEGKTLSIYAIWE